VSEILQAIGSPAWWFSAIIVAVIANVIANYIYDVLKAKVTGYWGSVLLWSLHISWSALFVASLFALPIRTDKAVAVALGFTIAAVFGLYEIYRMPAYGFAQMVTVASVFSLTFFEPEFPRALADRDLIWFGRQYFSCVLMSAFVQVLLAGIFYRRYARKHRGLAK
jgi:hypothetical protein